LKVIIGDVVALGCLWVKGKLEKEDRAKRYPNETQPDKWSMEKRRT